MRTRAVFGLVLLGTTSSGARAAELTPLPVPLEQAGYRRLARERGITVFEHRGSRDLRFAAEGVLDAPPAKLLSVVLDFERQARFSRRLSRSQILRRGPGWLTVYQRLTLPAISDRDYVLRVTWGDSAGIHWMSYGAISGVGPPSPSGVVRIRKHEGSWQFRAEPSRGHTLARYQMTMDLAGWIPRWMVRSQLADEVAATFASIQQLTGTKASRP